MSMQDSHRLFVALPLPDTAVRALQQVRQTLARRIDGRAVRWVRPEGMHLTLRFLGDCPPAMLPGLQEALDSAAGVVAPLTLSVSRLDCFRRQRPRVIWVGVADPGARLAALKQSIDSRLAPLGWPPEQRPFAPHITLGRVRRPRGPLPLPWGQPVAVPGWEATAVHLIESELRPQGAVYTVRHRAQFGAVIC